MTPKIQPNAKYRFLLDHIFVTV